MPTRFRSTFFGDLDVDVTFDAQVGAMTYFVVGGQADALVRPRSADALSVLLRQMPRVRSSVQGSWQRCKSACGRRMGVDGIVVKLDHECFKQTRYNRKKDVDKPCMPWAGADMASTLMETVRSGLDGLTAMAGIPASIGGAIRMNAGGKFGSISDSIESMTCLTNTGRTHDALCARCRFRISGKSPP